MWFASWRAPTPDARDVVDTNIDPGKSVQERYNPEPDSLAGPLLERG